MFSSAFIGFLPNVSAITSLTQFGYRDATVASNAGMLYLGSLITWLHNNQTDILENLTLLLARVRFIRAPQAAFWCGISKNSWRGLHYLPAEFSTFLLVTQQPRVLWQNGGHAWIYLVK